MKQEYERYKDLWGLNIHYSHSAGPTQNYSELVVSYKISAFLFCSYETESGVASGAYILWYLNLWPSGKRCEGDQKAKYVKLYQFHVSYKVTLVAQLGVIGGTMGLFTGFSILSGIEILYFAAKFFFRKISSYEQKIWINGYPQILKLKVNRSVFCLM